MRLSDLYARGVKIRTDGHRLLVDAPAGELGPEDWAAITAAKPQLLRILNDEAPEPCAVCDQPATDFTKIGTPFCIIHTPVGPDAGPLRIDAHGRVIYAAPVLGGEVIIMVDGADQVLAAQQAYPGRVIYTDAELRALEGTSEERRRAVHAVKREFAGSVQHTAAPTAPSNS